MLEALEPQPDVIFLAFKIEDIPDVLDDIVVILTFRERHVSKRSVVDGAFISRNAAPNGVGQPDASNDMDWFASRPTGEN